MALTKFPNGISSMGMPVIGGNYLTTGSVFFVDSNTGSNGNSGADKDHPFADIDYAIGQCTASKGDVIFVMPGHSETAATQITCDVAGVSIIGLGRGENRPKITAHASAVDLMNVTADDVYIENLYMYYAASQTAFINIGGADFHAHNCWFYGADTPADHVTVTTGGTRFKFTNCRFESETDGADTGILIEVTDINGWVVDNCIFNWHDVGLDEAAVYCSFKTSGYVFSNNLCIGMDLTLVDINSSTADGEGIFFNSHGAFTGGVSPADAIDFGGGIAIQCFASEDPDAAGGHIPPTSDS